MAEALASVISFIVPWVGACGVLMIIVLEVLRTATLYAITFIGRRPTQLAGLRLRLGQSMVMGLEFLQDRSVSNLEPHIVVGCTHRAAHGPQVLNYILEREPRVLDKTSASSGVERVSV